MREITSHRVVLKDTLEPPDNTSFAVLGAIRVIIEQWLAARRVFFYCIGDRRLIFNLKPRDHITSALQKLH